MNGLRPANTNQNERVTLNSLVYTADAANWKDTQKKAVDLYRQGKLFNIVLRGVGSIGDFEISKNRVYSNDAIIEAYSTYNALIHEFPYYRLMFDSHPSSESDEKHDMGEGNSYDTIAAYLLKLKLEDVKLNENTHTVISFDYVVTKQSILDYFMRSIDPIIAISHRGFMGNITKLPRNIVKTKNNNITFLNEAFKNLDFWDESSDSVDYVEFLRLLGFDLVTYPADFFCVSRKQDMIGFNVTDYDTVKDTNNISHNMLFQYVKDKCANVHSPYGILRMKVDKSYLLNNIKSEAALDEVTFILNDKREVSKMKIALDKLTNKEYMFGVFDDMAGMFIEVSELQAKDSDSIGDWLDSVLNDEFKSKIENKDELAASLRILIDNHDKFSTIFDEQNDIQTTKHNSNIIQVMVDAIGTDTFKCIMERGFNVTDEDVAKILQGYQDTNPELYESLNSNLITMAGDIDYYKQLAENILATASVNDNADPVTPEVTNTQEEQATSTEPIVDNQDTNTPPIEEPTVDGLNFSTKPSTDKWDGGSVKSVCSDIMSNEVLGEDDFKKMIDEVFCIVRSYDVQKNQKLPHHDVTVDGNNVTVTLNEIGVRAAANALLGARTSVIATADEKKAAAAHLKRHFDELNIEAPDGLSQVAENAKFADLVVDSDLVLALDEDFVKKIIDEETKIKGEAIDPEMEVNKVLDAIYIIMRPFVKDGAKIEINEDMFKKLARSVNGAAIGLAAVMNGEGSDIMNLEDNAIISTMRDQIIQLKDELTTAKDSIAVITQERNELLAKVTDYENKVETIGQLSEDVNNATKLVEDINNLNAQKMAFLFNNRHVVDEDIYNEIVGAKSADQLTTIGKQTSKLGNKKVTLSTMFTDKITPEPIPAAASVAPVATAPTADDGGVFQAPKPDSKRTETLDDDLTVKNILNLIKG